jgi:hypothetical protein
VAQERTSRTPHPWRSWAIALLAIVLLAVMWQQVFTMTGVLWWNAPQAEKPYPRPRAVHIRPVPTDWVDVDAYLKNNPEWQG